MGGFSQTNFVYCVFVVLLEMMIVAQIKSDNLCDIDIENTLRTLLTEDKPSVQVRALRRDLLKKLLEELDDEEEEKAVRRSLASLASSNNLPSKKNLESLARAGYIKTLPDEDSDDNNFKRSIAYLAKNGQLPQRIDDKRGVESLARNGDAHYIHKNMQDLLEELYGKRNIGSIARNYNLPSYGKRSLSSLAKSGDLYHRFQRNVASLAREGVIKGKREVSDKETLTDPQQDRSNEERSNQAATKAQFKSNTERSVADESSRNKREADYYYPNDEYPSPVYQSQNVYDYDELSQEFDDVYPQQDKRFLGSVARTGWFQPSSGSSRYSRFVTADKRHIGSLARLGWLPSFRHIRRFNRSGRSASSDDICREASSDGENEVNPDPKDSSISIDDTYRYYYRPLAEKPYVRSIFFHPRSH